MTLRDDLIAAKAPIDTPEKWRKSAGEDGRGTPCCMVVAANRVSHYYSDRNKNMRAALFNQLPEPFRDGRSANGDDIGFYNDAPTTTHADIMALFDRAIAAAEPAQ